MPFRQAGALGRILSMKEGGTLSQSFIFSGGEGWGKRHLSRAFARLLLCDKQAFPEACECSSCRRIEQNQHPDYRYFGEEDKRSVAIAEVRSLLEWMALKSFEGTAKVAVLIGSQRLTPEASNALLKLLEEPPPASYMILLTENPRRLLETIRSRCSMVRLRPLPVNDIAQRLEAKGIGKDEAVYLAKKSNGSFDQAVRMQEEGAWEDGKEFLRKICREPISSVISLWQKLDRAEITENIRRTEDVLRDALVLSLGGPEEQISFQNSLDDLSVLAGEGTSKLTRRIGYLLETDRALRSNVNQKLALTRLEIIWNV